MPTLRPAGQADPQLVRARPGWPGEDIACHLGIGRTTTYRHLKSEVFPERKGRSDAGRSSMDPWRDWIVKRWNKGQRNGRQTLRDLRAKGFTGNYATVLRYLRGTMRKCGVRRTR